MSQRHCLFREQSFIGGHSGRSISVVVSAIDGASIFAMQPGAVSSEGYQEAEWFRAALKINVVSFTHGTWWLELPSLTVGLLTLTWAKYRCADRTINLSPAVQ